MYTIYLHKFPNGKIYVGLTKTSLKRRWGEGKNYKSCVLLNRAIEKYGWESVEHGILDTAETKEDAEYKERIYIALFQSNDPSKGYNILSGGDVSKNIATDEMRYKLGNGNRGRHRTDEEKRKISNGVKKAFNRPESNGCIGKTATDETKKKMSNAHKEWYENNTDRIVEFSERMKKRWEDEEYRNKMLEVLSRGRKNQSPESFRWSEERKKKASESQTGKWVGEKSPCSKAVIQYTKDGEFVARYGSINEAGRAVGTTANNISKCCHGKPHHHTIAGYVWKFEQ